MPCARRGRARPPVSAAVALSLVVLYPSSSIFALAQFGDVPGAVSVSPIDPTDILDAIGLGDLFGGPKKPVVQLWYFWVCIAAAAIFVAAGAWFTYRGFKRWKSVREENRLKFLVPGAVSVQYFDEQTEDWWVLASTVARTHAQTLSLALRSFPGLLICQSGRHGPSSTARMRARGTARGKSARAGRSTGR